MIGGQTKDVADVFNYTSTASYYHDDFTWCINQAKALPTYWNLFFYVKDYEVILAGIVSLLGSVVTSYGLTGFERKPYDMHSLLIIALTIVICSSNCFKPEGYILRICFFSCNIVSLCLVSTFNAFLLVALTHPILMEQVGTISAIIHSNYQLAGSPYVFQKIIQQEMVRILCLWATLSIFYAPTNLIYFIFFSIHPLSKITIMCA